MGNNGGEGIVRRAIWQSLAILMLALGTGLLFNQVRSDRLPLVANWSTAKDRLVAETGRDMVISLEQAHRHFLSGDALLLDARAAEIYNEGHIKGARNLPWEPADSDLEAVMADIPRNALIITYCDGDSCSLSKDLATDLFYRGYENVRVLVNGWSRWVQAGFPTSPGSGAGFSK